MKLWTYIEQNSETMHLEQNSETMNLEQNNSNVYVHQFTVGADCMQKNTWFDRCHSAKLRLRSVIHSSRFMSLSSSNKDAYQHQSVFVFVCVYCVCYICMFNPTTWAHIRVCVCVLVIVRVFFRWETPTLWILFDWQPATSIVEICTPVASDEGVMMKHRK